MTSPEVDIYDQFSTGEPRRDGYGRYLIVPPQGGKPVGHTRVTTIAKALDDTGGLAPWKATMTAGGMIMRRGLRSRWEVLLAEYGDPWYATAESKKAAKDLVEECAAVGGANDRKELGSGLHTVTALVDVGRAPSHLTEETERDVKAYVRGRDAAGIKVVPGMVEVVVVLDDCQVAGTFDRLVTVPGFDLPLIADLKTGSSIEYSFQPFAVQLAAYSRADAIYRQGPAKDGSEDVRLPMPAVDQEYGLIFWLNAGTAELELWLVDLVKGWEAFQVSLWARAWRTDKDIAQDLASRPSLTLSVPAAPDPEQPWDEVWREQKQTELRRRVGALGDADKLELSHTFLEGGLPTRPGDMTDQQLEDALILVGDYDRRRAPHSGRPAQRPMP